MSKQVTITRGEGELVGSAEAAEILGTKPPQITRWVESGTMPEALDSLRATKVWLRSEVEALAERRRNGS